MDRVKVYEQDLVLRFRQNQHICRLQVQMYVAMLMIGPHGHGQGEQADQRRMDVFTGLLVIASPFVIADDHVNCIIAIA